MTKERTPRINRKSAKDDIVELLKNAKDVNLNTDLGGDVRSIYQQGILDAARVAGIKIKPEDYAE